MSNVERVLEAHKRAVEEFEKEMERQAALEKELKEKMMRQGAEYIKPLPPAPIVREVHHHHYHEGQTQPAPTDQTGEEDKGLPIPEGKTKYSPEDWGKIFRATSGAGRRPDYADIAQRTGKDAGYIKRKYNEWRNTEGNETIP